MDTTPASSLRKTRSGWESQQAPLLVSKRDAAAMLSLCVRTIDKLIATKELPARRVGKRVLIPHSALVQFARRDHIGRIPEGLSMPVLEQRPTTQAVGGER